MGLASASETSLAGRAERARIKAQRKEERAQADAANQQNASDGTAASLVDDKNAISMDDVMSYAGGLRCRYHVEERCESRGSGIKEIQRWRFGRFRI